MASPQEHLTNSDGATCTQTPGLPESRTRSFRTPASCSSYTSSEPRSTIASPGWYKLQNDAFGHPLGRARPRNDRKPVIVPRDPPNATPTTVRIPAASTRCWHQRPRPQPSPRAAAKPQLCGQRARQRFKTCIRLAVVGVHACAPRAPFPLCRAELYRPMRSWPLGG